ncbi:MAG: helix-turn-helix domain-containing protein, partial [Planctomycetota bacterium]
NRRMVPMRVNRLRVRNIEDLLLATGGNREFRPVQMGPSNISGELAMTTVDGLTLTYGNFRSDIHVSGTMSNDRLSLGVLLAAEGIGSFGKHARPGDLVVVGKGRENDGRYRGQLEYLVMNVDKADVLGVADAHDWTIAPRRLDGSDLLRLDKRGSARLLSRVEPVAQSLRTGSLCEMGPAAHRALADEMLVEFTRAVSESGSIDGVQTRPLPKLVQRAEEWLADNPGRPCCNRTLAQRLRVSPRQLFRAFHAEVGMSPAKYLKRYRMTQARLALLAADPAETTVTNLAVQWGFWELGRFAVEYHRVFGECPSQSLRTFARARGSRRARSGRPAKTTAATSLEG